MGKTIWEFIDLDERINSPCTTRSIRPISEKTEGLCLTLLNGIKSGKITEVYADDYFNTKKTLKDMSSSFNMLIPLKRVSTKSITTMMITKRTRA
jgi:hypothetical protein